MTKSELRKLYLERQRAISTRERAEKSSRIARRFFQEFDLSRIRFLHCFITIEKFNEIDTSLFFQRLWRDFPHVQTIVPRVNIQSGVMENLRFTPDTALVRNVWEIDEPSLNEYVESDKIDIVLAPLLCFDRMGHRVGYGKGFYDRFLGKCRTDCLKIGLSYFAPVDAITDVGKYDVSIEKCVTPRAIFTAETLRR